MLKKAWIDMMGRTVEIPHSPQRIISLVPSQTELLYDLGLQDQIVGQTVFCIHPQQYFFNSTKIGGTKKVKFQVIDDLKPDLIIGNKEENSLEIVEQLSSKYPVWLSDIYTLEEAYSMINQIGEICNVSDKANQIVEQIQNSFASITPQKLGTCLYLIWKDPYMTVGQNTFINNIIEKIGFTNVVQNSRYPEISIEEMLKLNPQNILLSSEPYPFKQKHIDQLQVMLPSANIRLIDGEMFSWYGSRMKHSVAYFKEHFNV
jgi:ABC-type Fe3+-hydroxamate transport system substrate-binding protein